MGRGLSQLQREILAAARASGTVTAADAVAIAEKLDTRLKFAFNGSPRRTEAMRKNRRRIHAAAVSRALSRLVVRGLLAPGTTRGVYERGALTDRNRAIEKSATAESVCANVSAI